MWRSHALSQSQGRPAWEGGGCTAGGPPGSRRARRSSRWPGWAPAAPAAPRCRGAARARACSAAAMAAAAGRADAPAGAGAGAGWVRLPAQPLWHAQRGALCCLKARSDCVGRPSFGLGSIAARGLALHAGRGPTGSIPAEHATHVENRPSPVHATVTESHAKS